MKIKQSLPSVLLSVVKVKGVKVNEVKVNAIPQLKYNNLSMQHFHQLACLLQANSNNAVVYNQI